MTLLSDPNFGESDDFYDAFLAAHKGLGEVESHALNARLILILANHIGDLDLLIDALELARST